MIVDDKTSNRSSSNQNYNQDYTNHLFCSPETLSSRDWDGHIGVQKVFHIDGVNRLSAGPMMTTIPDYLPRYHREVGLRSIPSNCSFDPSAVRLILGASSSSSLGRREDGPLRTGFYRGGSSNPGCLHRMVRETLHFSAERRKADSQVAQYGPGQKTCGSIHICLDLFQSLSIRWRRARLSQCCSSPVELDLLNRPTSPSLGLDRDNRRPSGSPSAKISQTPARRLTSLQYQVGID
jgi:hypothetical protein